VHNIDRKRPEIVWTETYVWNREKRFSDENENIGSLHAKVAIVDRRKVLLSSANLTKYALDLNMELGFLFENNLIASEVISHFEDLQRRRVFVKQNAF
jgi:phosphatidylserine/phosphatidylglycerophosphate/cardiolipin synthase-like enzyme